MTAKEILELVRAGYTKAEIAELTNPTESEQVEAPPVETEPEEVEPGGEVEEVPEQGKPMEWADLMREIADLKKMVHGANVRRGVETAPKGDVCDEIADFWIGKKEEK